MHFGSSLDPLGSMGHSRQPHGVDFKVNRIKTNLLIKVFRHDSLIKKIPLIVGLTYCAAIEELLGKVPVPPAGNAQEVDNFFSTAKQFSMCFITSPVLVPSSCVH